MVFIEHGLGLAYKRKPQNFDLYYILFAIATNIFVVSFVVHIFTKMTKNSILCMPSQYLAMLPKKHNMPVHICIFLDSDVVGLLLQVTLENKATKCRENVDWESSNCTVWHHHFHKCFVSVAYKEVIMGCFQNRAL